MKRLVLVVLSFFFASISFAIEADIELELRANKEQIGKGEQFQVITSLKIANSKSHINLQQIPVPGVEHFLPVGTSQSTRAQMMDGQMAAVSEVQKTLLAHQIGTFHLGPVQFSLQSSDGEITKVASNTIAITVTEPILSIAEKNYQAQQATKSALEDESEKIFERSKKQVESFPIEKIIKVFLAFFFIGGGLALSFYLRQPQREQKQKKAQEVKAQKVWEQQKRTLKLPNTDSMNFYPEMRAFVVDYIYNEKQVEVGTMTTREVLEGIEGAEIQDKITNILKACDNHRYARVEVDRRQLLQMARQLMNNE